MVRLLREPAGSNPKHETQRFNPTMVRLLLGLGQAFRQAFGLFQSHNGAIAADTLGRKARRFPCFNPTMVRLLQLVGEVGYAHIEVSIPQWCDCCNCSV